MTKPWQMIPLGEVVLAVERGEFPVPGKSYRQVGIRLWGVGAYERESLDGGQTKYATLNRVEEGDIIVNKIWARNGSVAVVPPALTGCFASSEFPTFAPNRDRLDPRWFHWVTKTAWFWQRCDEQSRGTSGKNRIRPEKFLGISIPLPPLSEQRRIVAKIDALAAKIAEARALRQQAAEEADGLVRSALHHLRYRTVTKTLPIAECSGMKTGTTPPSERTDYYRGPIQWFTPGDIGDRKELERSTRTLSEVAVAQRKARLFEPGTLLLVAIGGSLGKVGLTRKTCSANQQITGIRFCDDVIPDWGYWWLKRLTGDLVAAAPQATLPIINQERIGAFEITIPPIPEQRRLVSELDGLQAQVDAFKALQAQTAAELDALLPSILDRAFKGEL